MQTNNDDAADACICNNFACQIRIARGLKPFCRIQPAPSVPPKPLCDACAKRAESPFGFKNGITRCRH